VDHAPASPCSRPYAPGPAKTEAKANCCVADADASAQSSFKYVPRPGYSFVDVRAYANRECTGDGTPDETFTCDGTCQRGAAGFDYTCALNKWATNGEGVCPGSGSSGSTSGSSGGSTTGTSNDCIKGEAGCMEMLSYATGTKTCAEKDVTSDALRRVGKCTAPFKKIGSIQSAMFTCEGTACRGVSYSEAGCSGTGMASPVVLTCDGTCQSMLGLAVYKCTLGRAISAGTIVAISGGAVALVLLVAAGVVFARRRRRAAAAAHEGFLSLD
jgi:hypothetical protein